MLVELAALAVTATASSSLLAPDFAPTVAIVATEEIELRVGGLVQVHAAALAGEDSLIENGDLADESGFRLRRARLGVSARFGESVGVYLAANLLSSDDDVGSVSDATLSYVFADWLAVSAGLGKLPFSRAALAQRLSLPEIRLGGMLSAVRRILNVDQAAVLVIDEAAGTVELNIALLHQQFRVGGPGGQR